MVGEVTSCALVLVDFPPFRNIGFRGWILLEIGIRNTKHSNCI